MAFDEPPALEIKDPELLQRKKLLNLVPEELEQNQSLQMKNLFRQLIDLNLSLMMLHQNDLCLRSKKKMCPVLSTFSL